MTIMAMFKLIKAKLQHKFNFCNVTDEYMPHERRVVHPCFWSYTFERQWTRRQQYPNEKAEAAAATHGHEELEADSEAVPQLLRRFRALAIHESNRPNPPANRPGQGHPSYLPRYAQLQPNVPDKALRDISDE